MLAYPSLSFREAIRPSSLRLWGWTEPPQKWKVL